VRIGEIRRCGACEQQGKERADKRAGASSRLPGWQSGVRHRTGTIARFVARTGNAVDEGFADKPLCLPEGTSVSSEHKPCRPALW
jgi:hypothetical protein